MLGITPRTAEPEGEINHQWYRGLAEQALYAFPNLDMQVITLREGNSAASYGWSGCLHNRREFFTSSRYEIADVVDRVGAGDSFTAGLIYRARSKQVTALRTRVCDRSQLPEAHHCW